MAVIASPLNAAYDGPVCTAEQVADTDAKVIMTVAERTALNRAVETIIVGRPSDETIDGNPSEAGIYVFADPVLIPQGCQGYIDAVWAYNDTGAPQSARVGAWSKAGDIFTEAANGSVTLAPGFNLIEGLELAILNNQRTGIVIDTYAAFTYQTGAEGDSGGYYAVTGETGASFTDASVTTNVRLMLGFRVRYNAAPEARVALIEEHLDTTDVLVDTNIAALDKLAATVPVEIFNRTTDPYVQFTAPLSERWAFGFMGSDLPEGAQITRLYPVIRKPVGAVSAEVVIFRRASADLSAPNVGDETLLTVSVDISAMADDTFGEIEVVVPSVVTSDVTKGYYLTTLTKNDSNVTVNHSAGSAGDGSTLNQLQRGFYRSGGGWSNVGAAAKLALRIEEDQYQVRQSALPPVEDTTSYADVLTTPYVDVSVAGAVISVDGLLRRNGSNTAISADVTLTLATSGQERVDHIIYNRSTGVVSAVAGAARTANLDAIEWQAAVPSNSIVLARALVGSADVKAVNTAEFRGLIKVGHEGELASLIQRNRALFAPILAMASRAAPVKWLGTGDSLCAMQDTSDKPATLADQYLPNGIWRDRRNYYFASYPSDSLALIPTYDFGDGETDHIRLGENWAIKAALDEIAGASVVTYYNTGIGSSTSANTLVSNVPNLLYPARLAADLTLNVDVAALMIGMNDRATPTITYANVCAWIDAHLGNGAKAVVIYGCPRPNKAESVSAWRIVNDGLEAAALDKGVIWVPTTTISDDRNLGGIGVPAETLCSANEITAGRNHRGYFEARRYEQNALMMLGL